MGGVVMDEGSSTEGTVSGTLNLFGEPEGDELHAITLRALLVDGKTVVEQRITDLTIKKDTDAHNIITLYLEARSDEPLPDVKPEGGSNSGFGADVEEWGGVEEKEVEIPI